MKFCLGLLSVLTVLIASRSYGAGSCPTARPIERAAFVGDETVTEMRLLAEATKAFREVYFVPMIEHVSRGGVSPQIPDAVVVFRGPDKFDRLAEKKPQGITTTAFSYADKLAALPECAHPFFVILAGKETLLQYEALPASVRHKLRSTKFVSFWHSRLKQPSAFHGVGRSLLKVMNALKIGKEKRILLLGYGQTGKGIASYLRKDGHKLGIFDVDSAEMVVALHDGFAVGPLSAMAQNADVVIDATGAHADVLTPEKANYFRRPTVYVLASSSTDQGITIKDGFKNEHGTVFTLHPSHGLVNNHHDVGAFDDDGARAANFVSLYLLKNYPAIAKGLVSVSGNLDRLSPALESQIGAAFLKEPQLLGGSAIPNF